MSHSIRFLGFAVLAWAGVRAASLAFYPGSIAPIAPQGSTLPKVAETRFDPPPPPDPVPQQAYYPGLPPGYGLAHPGAHPGAYPGAYPGAFLPAYVGHPRGDRTIIIPASWPVSQSPRRGDAGGWAGIMPTPQPPYYATLSSEPWPNAAAVSTPAMRPRDSGGAPSFPSTPSRPPRFDRLQPTA